jgi:dipeptidyl-peptidase-3
LEEVALKVWTAGERFGLRNRRQLAQEIVELRDAIFNPDYRPMLTVKNPPPGQDIISASSCNLYENVSLKELESVKEGYKLNSRIARIGRRIVEQPYRAGTRDGRIRPGRYARQLRQMISSIELGIRYADPAQKAVLRKLVRFYRTGMEKDWLDYNVAWVKTNSQVDMISGFVETYLDPRGAKGSFETIVSFIDPEATKLMQLLAENALYFEARAPWKDEYKKREFEPPVANAINVLLATGEGGPFCPAGINLPNEQAIRQKYGTKSVLLTNIMHAATAAIGEKAAIEFSSTDQERERAARYRVKARDLLVAMHEVVGHGSGQVSETLKEDPHVYLKEYYSTLEECRADLVALWDFWDPKLEEIGVQDYQEVAKAGYDAYARSGLVMLNTYRDSTTIEEDHDRATQLVINYVAGRNRSIQSIEVDSKVYLVVNDYARMREAVGELLSELMRIKAEGDYDSVRRLVNEHAINLNTAWRDQVVERCKRINLPRKAAFIMPILEPTRDSRGRIADVRIRYPQSFTELQLHLAKQKRTGIGQ